MTPADPVNASFSSRLAPPRLIRWLATVGLVILGITTAFRVLALGTFVRPEDSAEAIARILVLGLRYDLRLVALLLLTQRLRGVDADGAAVAVEPAAQGDTAGKDPGREVNLHRMGVAVTRGIGGEHPA